MDRAVGSALLIISLSAAAAANAAEGAPPAPTDSAPAAAPGTPPAAPGAAAAPSAAAPAPAKASAKKPATQPGAAPEAPAAAAPTQAAPTQPAPTQPEASAPAEAAPPAAGAAAEGSAAAPPAAAAPAAPAAAAPLLPTAAEPAAPAAAPEVAPSAPAVSFSVGVAAQDPSSASSNPDQPIAPPPPTNPVSAAATPADKPANAGVTKDQQEERLPSGLSISVGAGMNFGSSTFVPVTDSTRYVRDPMVDWSLAISPSYSFPDNTRVSASASISQELTKADGDDAPNTLLFGDISLGVGRPLYQFENGPKINGSLSARIPTSTASRVDSLITSIGAGLNSGMNFGKFGVSAGLGYRKNFHRYTHPTRHVSTGRPYKTQDGLVIEDVVTGIARTGGSELAGNTYFDGESNNTSMVLSGTLGASYSLTDRIGFGLSYGLAKSWTYDSYPVDDLSSPYASAGRGQHDTQTGTLSANYRAFDNLSFGLGMATAGGIFRADNKSYRFPFYAFEGAESNMTTFFVNATYTESIPL